MPANTITVNTTYGEFVTTYNSHVANTNAIETSANNRALKAGDTFTGTVILNASNTTNVSLRIPHGTAPSSGVNGDIWTTTTGLFARISGANRQFAPTDNAAFTGLITLPSGTSNNTNLLTRAGATAAFANSANGYTGTNTGAAIFKFTDNNFYIDNYDGTFNIRVGANGAITALGFLANGQPTFASTPLVGSTPVALSINATFSGNTTFTGEVRNRANMGNITLTDAATINWDCDNGVIAYVTLGGNRTMAAPTNLRIGTYILHVLQDATGGRTLTWNSVFKWNAGVAPTLTATANRRDIFSFISDGTNLYGSFSPDMR